MELMDLYDANEKLLGKTIGRGDPIPDGTYLLGAEVLVRHISGDYLLVRRSPNKRVYPNYYEATAGGGALAGEDALTCIKRELFEETGIDSAVFNELAVTRNGKFFCHSFFAVTIPGVVFSSTFRSSVFQVSVAYLYVLNHYKFTKIPPQKEA